MMVASFSVLGEKSCARDYVSVTKLFRENYLLYCRPCSASTSNAVLLGGPHSVHLVSTAASQQHIVSVFFVVAEQSTAAGPRASILIHISSSCICSKLWSSSVLPRTKSPPSTRLQATRAATILSLNDEKEHPGRLLPALSSCLLRQPTQHALWLLPSWRPATDRLSSTSKVRV